MGFPGGFLRSQLWRSIHYVMLFKHKNIQHTYFFLGSGKASRRKSVSASAVPPKTDESRLTRSRSTSTSVKVLDVMFTPVKVKSASRKKETEKLEESRLSKRYAVNPARKSYKIPKWRILFYIILCTAVKCKNWLSHNNLSIVIYFFKQECRIWSDM